MTNQMIIMLEQEKLFKEGKIKSTGRTIKVVLNDEEKEIPELEAIHTFQVWKLLGYSVKKGEKAIAKFPIWKHTSKTVTNEQGEDEEKTNMFLKESAFFSASQVEKLETNKSERNLAR